MQKTQEAVCYLQEQLEEASATPPPRSGITSCEEERRRQEQELREREREILVCVCVCVCVMCFVVHVFFIFRKKRR